MLKKLKHCISQYHNTAAFLKAWAINPKTTGAVLPSSKKLADAMVSYVQLSTSGCVVELGAGTGMITKAMLDHGISAQQIIAVEYVPHLVKKLRHQFPGVQIIEGNAANLAVLLKSTKRPIDTIISGLPLRSLRKEMAQSILLQIPELLSDTGRFIQFTYDIVRDEKKYYPDDYHLIDSTLIWRNIPPAKISVFTFRQEER